MPKADKLVAMLQVQSGQSAARLPISTTEGIDPQNVTCRLPSRHSTCYIVLQHPLPFCLRNF